MSSQSHNKLKQALLNPANIFKSPKEVLAQDDLSREDKIKILKRWEYDQRELEVAEEENMGNLASNNDLSILDEILAALHILDPEHKIDDSSPTKHGGE